ncbi:MAG: helix-turn-helix domain-containing protein [Acidimicrobiales bacterium]
MAAPTTTGEGLAISVDEAARLLGISRDLAYDLVRRGELPSVRLGRRIVVPRVKLDVVLAKAAGGPPDTSDQVSRDPARDRAQP